MRDFRELKIWQRSHQITLSVYKVTTKFPKDELFGITSQIRRSSASVSANIAEGCGRNGGADMARFLQIALGSASELEYHLLLSFHLGLLGELEHSRLNKEVTEVKRMLTSFIKKPGADR